MGKRNCCVPTCVNSWGNSPGVKYHSLPKDKAVLKEYKRISGNHFPGGEQMSHTQLPSIFPWTKTPSKVRHEIVKHDLPSKRKKSEVLK